MFRMEDTSKAFFAKEIPLFIIIKWNFEIFDSILLLFSPAFNGAFNEKQKREKAILVINIQIYATLFFMRMAKERNIP